MTDRDLTPDEARAEVEAFMGEGWRGGSAKGAAIVEMHCWRRGVDVSGSGITYRAAVDALKQAWRDAVRPWAMEAMNEGSSMQAEARRHQWSVEQVAADVFTRLARVLKKDSNG